MAADVKPTGWDFSEARQLLNSFTYPTHNGTAAEFDTAATFNITPKSSTSQPDASSKLGDFAKLFESLTVKPVSNGDINIQPAFYTSDGAATPHVAGKRINWGEIVDSVGDEDQGDAIATLLRQVQPRGALRTLFEHDGLLDSVTPDFAAILLDLMLTLPSRNSNIPPSALYRQPDQETPASESKNSKSSKTPAKRKARRRRAAAEVVSEGDVQQSQRQSPAQKAGLRRSARIAGQKARVSRVSLQHTDAIQQPRQKTYQAALPAQVTQPWVFQNGSEHSDAVQLPTPSYGAGSAPNLHSAGAFVPHLGALDLQTATHGNHNHDKTVRDFQLRLKLIQNFPEDRQWLMAAVPMANHFHTPQNNGIHVFVDYSNISIGFLFKVQQLRHEAHRRGESLKMSQDLSFDSLVLLLERGRPVAKRVLAGSNHSDPAIAKARAVGYDVKILHRVYKDETVAEKDRRAAALSSTPKGVKHAYGMHIASSEAQSSFPQTANGKAPASPSNPPMARQRSVASRTITAPVAMPMSTAPGTGRWVEQGVDEILHMTIYESVIDSDTPSTIVLATGDGAQAEFSDGFVATVERALVKGWSVELVSWRKGMNFLWRDEGWRGKWGERFRILELDGWEGWIEEPRV